MNKQANICVIGCGIIGLSSAYHLAINYPGCKITIVAEYLPPNTVSNHSFGSIWIPNSLKGFKGENDNKYVMDTFNHFYNIIQNYPELAQKMGVDLNDGHHVFDTTKSILEKESEIFLKTSPNFRKGNMKDKRCRELKENFNKYGVLFGREDIKFDDVAVYQYNTIAVDVDKYLNWMINEMEEMVGKGHINNFEIKQRSTSSFTVLQDEGFDLVVNCSGMGARELCGDNNMVPIRGQYLVCKRPSKKSKFTACVYDNTLLMFPLSDRVLVGSIFQLYREDDFIDEEDTRSLIERARTMWPDVEDHIIRVETAIRPARVKGCRLELEVLSAKNGSKLNVVHNYGHGSKGIMLHWGCAKEIAILSKQLVFQSKL